MSALLPLFRKFQLIRERNQETLNQMRSSNMVSRVEKNIKNVQKMYTSRIAKLEEQAKRKISSASIWFRQMSGLGANQINTNMGAYWNGGGMLTGFMLGQMQGMIGKDIKDKDGKSLGSIDKEKYQAMLQAYTRYGQQGMMYEHDTNGNLVTKKNNDGKDEYVPAFKDYEVNAFLGGLQNAQMAQNMAQSNLAQVSQNYENNVSIWLEAAKEELEAQQEAALEPLNYQQTMWELEKTYSEQKLKRIESELEFINQLVDKETKDSAPTFGLK